MSRQDYETPDEFIKAVEYRFFAKFTWDLAAHSRNAKCKKFLSPKEDSLSVDWGKLRGDLWLNPPFSRIEPWVKKCSKVRRFHSQRIFLLVPASVATRWFIEHVYNYASVHPLFPRIAFKGQKQGINRDMMLCVYGGNRYDFSPWRWKK